MHWWTVRYLQISLLFFCQEMVTVMTKKGTFARVKCKSAFLIGHFLVCICKQSYEYWFGIQRDYLLKIIATFYVSVLLVQMEFTYELVLLTSKLRTNYWSAISYLHALRKGLWSGIKLSLILYCKLEEWSVPIINSFLGLLAYVHICLSIWLLKKKWWKEHVYLMDNFYVIWGEKPEKEKEKERERENGNDRAFGLG
jgi:hypothetical protein